MNVFLVAGLFLIMISPGKSNARCPREAGQYQVDSPEYVVATILAAIEHKDASIARGLTTEKGRSLLVYILSGSARYNIPSFDVIDCRVSNITNLDAWYEMSLKHAGCPNNLPGGPYICEFVMRKYEKAWLFDDVLIKKYCGLEMNIHMSMIQSDLVGAETLLLVRNPMSLGVGFLKTIDPGVTSGGVLDALMNHLIRN